MSSKQEKPTFYNYKTGNLYEAIKASTIAKIETMEVLRETYHIEYSVANNKLFLYEQFSKNEEMNWQIAQQELEDDHSKFAWLSEDLNGHIFLHIKSKKHGTNDSYEIGNPYEGL